jgi:hypothetical protein
MKRAISLDVNGVTHENEVEPRLLLVHYLRDVLGLTGTHVGCETSLCGACTVFVEGQAVKSCTMFAVQASGSKVTTIEGLAKNGELHPVQEGFWERHGLRLLHPRNDHGVRTDPRQKCPANKGRNPSRSRRQSLPMYWLPAHCGSSGIRIEKGLRCWLTRCQLNQEAGADGRRQNAKWPNRNTNDSGLRVSCCLLPSAPASFFRIGSSQGTDPDYPTPNFGGLKWLINTWDRELSGLKTPD